MIVLFALNVDRALWPKTNPLPLCVFDRVRHEIDLTQRRHVFVNSIIREIATSWRHIGPTVA